jgi:hypothetical protein
LSVETFWERYDWTSDKGKLHSRPVPESEKKENNSVIVEGQELEWTKQGVEDILGTVGVQAVYNAEVSPPPDLSTFSSSPHAKVINESYDYVERAYSVVGRVSGSGS